MKLIIAVIFSLHSLVSCQLITTRHLILVGCFKEGPDYDAKYIVNRWKSMTMTHEECLMKCKNGTDGPYVGLYRVPKRNDATCLCTKGYGGEGPSDECRQPCPGNRNQICGGGNSVTYLHTFLVASNAFPDTSSPLSATVFLMLATTVVLIGGTAFAASKTYSATAKSKAQPKKQDKGQAKSAAAKTKTQSPQKPASKDVKRTTIDKAKPRKS